MENSVAKRFSGGKRAALACAAAVALTGGIVFGASPAFAGTGDCPSGYLCTWGDQGFQTSSKGNALIKFQYYIPNYGTLNYAGTSQNGANSASSIYNHGTSETAYIYANTYKSGFLFSIPKGNSNNDLWWQGSQNDNIESGYYASYN